MLWKANEFLVFLALVGLFWLATEAGFRLGYRYHDKSDETQKSHVGALQSAMLGLLALLLAFSFAMAVARYDTRKSLVLQEANAIGTTYLRAGFLPEDQGQEARNLLRDYVTARLEFAEAKIEPAKLERAYANAARLQSQLWSIAETAVAQDPRSVPAGLFVESLNDVIDVSEARRVAFDNHVPEPVLLLLFAMCCGALGFVGCTCGLAGRRRLPSTIAFIVMSAMVLIIIMDIDRPRRGLIQVSQDSMLRLQTSLAGDKP